MKGGSPPTLLKARTGLLTPPGMTFWAAANRARLRSPARPSPGLAGHSWSCIAAVSVVAGLVGLVGLVGLLRGLLAGGGGGDAGAVLGVVGVVVVVDEALDGDDALVVAGADHTDALGVAADLGDLRDAGADHLAAAGHDHDLVVRFDGERADDRAVAAADLDRDDAEAAAVLDLVVAGRGALAVALGAHRQDRGVR